MVAKTGHKERVLALLQSVKDLVENGARDPERVARALQLIKDGDTRFLLPSAKLRTKRIPFMNRPPHEQWEYVYKTVCGKRNIDCAGIHMPPQPTFACWPIIIMPQVPLNALYAAMNKAFPCWSYYGDDLEKAIDWQQEERDGRTNPYGVWVKAIVEATEDLNNCSAHTIKNRGLTTTTLHERLCLEAFHWVITGGKNGGKHLDPIGWNPCPGSRYSAGRVPRVDSRDGRVRVRWAFRGYANPRVGVRQVVTL